MKAVKILVIVMTVALIGGLGLLVYGMATQTASLGGSKKAFGSVELEVPNGSRIQAIVADQGLLYLHLATAAGERIVVLDGRTGRRKGEVTLKPKAQ